MSEEFQNTINKLTTENNELKSNLQNNVVGIKTLLAQIDAYREVVNEYNQININIRTNMILLKKQNEELIDRLKTADTKLVELENKVASHQ